MFDLIKLTVVKSSPDYRAVLPNSDLNVPAATKESKNSCAAKLQDMTWKKSYQNEHDPSIGDLIYPSCNVFLHREDQKQQTHSSEAETKQLLVKKESGWLMLIKEQVHRDATAGCCTQIPQ